MSILKDLEFGIWIREMGGMNEKGGRGWSEMWEVWFYFLVLLCFRMGLKAQRFLLLGFFVFWSLG